MRPLEGVRVADFTGAWAGAFASQVVAMLGAEVIKIESSVRPDGARFGSVRRPTEDQWWEFAPIFQGANTDKRDITLDLGREEGRQLARRLVAMSDVVMENFSPRVMEQFDLGYDTVRRLNPAAVMVRMPAFGLSGPWRDRIGYAQSMEQVSGMAWVTGYEDGQPIIPRGLCDPLAGVHAVIGLMVALAHREKTGEGQLVEASMVEAALNIAAEPIVEFSAYGALLGRRGNHGARSVPQNVYACAGDDDWVAIAAATDGHWKSLCRALGSPAWAAGPGMGALPGRRREEQLIDERIGEWCRPRPAADVVERLWAAGVPVAHVERAWDVHRNPQLCARRFFEQVSHPLVGRHDRYPGLPFKLSGGPDRWHRTGAPTLGQDNDAVLRWLLGLSTEEIASLRVSGVIGERPRGT
jgi:crotonobetainyl-CoA:carnitine CoA-transferase CaiB-like acyl-CoA transferase